MNIFQINNKAVPPPFPIKNDVKLKLEFCYITLKNA
jgi:hypothetical protein